MSVSINIVETKVSGDAPVQQVVTANIAPTETVTASIPAARGPSGQDGQDGAGASAHFHNQASPSALWTINHNLGYRPNPHVVDSAGDECLGAVNHIDTNTLTITFSAPFSGTARVL